MDAIASWCCQGVWITADTGDLQRRNELVTHGWRPLTFSWRTTDSAIIKTMDGVYDRSTGQWRVGAENGGAFNRKVTHHS